MDGLEFIKSVIIPILASLICGAFTCIGVMITIIYENRKRKEERRLQNKPLFYRLDYRQGSYDYKETIDYYLGVDNSDKKEGQIDGTIKNTDNAILIIEGVSVNGKIYKSLFGNVVDKNQVFYLCVNVSEKLNKDDEIIFIVKDILENEYRYTISTNYKDGNCEIIGFKEIKE